MVVAQESCWKTLKEVHDISACLWCDFLFSNACDIYVSAAVSLAARSLKHIASSDKWKKNAHEEVEVLKFVHQTWQRWKSVKSEIHETLLRQEAARHLVATGRKVTGELQEKGAGDPNPYTEKLKGVQLQHQISW